MAPLILNLDTVWSASRPGQFTPGESFLSSLNNSRREIISKIGECGLGGNTRDEE
jgi:hypothetical protein